MMPFSQLKIAGSSFQKSSTGRSEKSLCDCQSNQIVCNINDLAEIFACCIAT